MKLKSKKISNNDVDKNVAETIPLRFQCIFTMRTQLQYIKKESWTHFKILVSADLIVLLLLLNIIIAIPDIIFLPSFPQKVKV